MQNLLDLFLAQCNGFAVLMFVVALFHMEVNVPHVSLVSHACQADSKMYERGCRKGVWSERD